MKLKLRDYRASKKHIVRKYKTAFEDSGSRASAKKRAVELMVFSGVPIVAGYMFIMEECPDVDFTEEIEKLVEFYDYKEIIK